MGWLVVLVAVVALLGGGGLYQLVTGRYVGIGRFSSTYDPSPRAARIAGAAGVFGAGCMVLLWLGASTGAIHAG